MSDKELGFFIGFFVGIAIGVMVYSLVARDWLTVTDQIRYELIKIDRDTGIYIKLYKEKASE